MHTHPLDGTNLLAILDASHQEQPHVHRSRLASQTRSVGTDRQAYGITPGANHHGTARLHPGAKHASRIKAIRDMGMNEAHLRGDYEALLD